MSRLSVGDYFTSIAHLVAARATCPRRQVGCVIVSEENHILATGYNGVPKSMPHCIDSPCPGAQYATGEGLDKCQATHAEYNALEQCNSLEQARTVYITTSPCVACLKLLINTPITHLVFADTYITWHNINTMWTATGRTWEQLNECK